MSGQMVKVGDKIVVLKDKAFGTNEPAGTVLTVVRLKESDGFGDFHTSIVNPFDRIQGDTWYWYYKSFDNGDIKKVDLDIFGELGD